mmetsp:Transcript_22439/g.42785  ORF Transcript_22439/g.42785 Transcript_22439/m.42785 type:complete len:215 (+) Transcript_22439:1664-2308(+)
MDMSPLSSATAFAVEALSPVTMMTLTPAPRQAYSASRTSGRTGSCRNVSPIKVNDSSGVPCGSPACLGSALGASATLYMAGSSRIASATHRIARLEARASISALSSAVNSTTSPAWSSRRTHRSSTTSGAPFVYSMCSPPRLSTTEEAFRVDEKLAVHRLRCAFRSTLKSTWKWLPTTRSSAFSVLLPLSSLAPIKHVEVLTRQVELRARLSTI